MKRLTSDENVTDKTIQKKKENDVLKERRREGEGMKVEENTEKARQMNDKEVIKKENIK